MKLWVIGLSAVGTIMAAVASYASRAARGDKPTWLVDWAIANRGTLSVIVLCIAALGTAWEVLRHYLEKRDPHRKVLYVLVADLSKHLFPGGARDNRITLLKVGSGWGVMFRGLLNIVTFRLKEHKRKALWRIQLRDKYARSYLRPADCRSPISHASFRVSDHSHECEGVVGLVWDRGQVMLFDLPRVDRAAVQPLKTQAELDAKADLMEYATTTKVSDLRLLKSCNNYARHFFGVVIKRNDGSQWGVLLLDSIADDCPFIENSVPSARFTDCFSDYARLMGRIVS